MNAKADAPSVSICGFKDLFTASNRNGRGFPPAEMFNKGLEIWYLRRASKDGRPVFVAEGFLGRLNLWQNGYRCSVALMGSDLHPEQADLLRSEFDSRCFILDPAEAGQKVKAEVLSTPVPRLPVRIVEPQKQVDLMTGEKPPRGSSEIYVGLVENAAQCSHGDLAFFGTITVSTVWSTLRTNLT